MCHKSTLHLLSVAGLFIAAAAGAIDPPPAPPSGQKSASKSKDTKYWKDALVPIKDQPGLPRVLLIGDSVSVGYTVFARELLKGEANVHRIPDNAGHTGKSLEKIDGWLGDGKWDVIHFNWGLHDLRSGVNTSVEQYEQNLRKLVKRMQATGAKLIWCSTTPLPGGVARSAAATETLLSYNAAAKKVMEENGIAINDLYGLARPTLAELQVPRSAHFTEAGSRVLAKQVAASIRKVLKGPAATAPGKTPAPPAAPPAIKQAPAPASSDAAAPLEPTLGKKGGLLLEEKFDGNSLPKGWLIKAGDVRVVSGVLRASRSAAADRLCLFNCEVPMQDAAIQIDFKFDGARGINVSCNPAPGELKKHGHLFSVMITPNMWNITEHNDKADRNSQSKVLASAVEKFEAGRWYTLLLETKGADVVARIEGKKPLRASSNDFRVKKPGIEFRVAGKDKEAISFDNLRVWGLK